MGRSRSRDGVGLRHVRLDSCVGAHDFYLSCLVLLTKTDSVQILCIIPVAILRWVLSGIGFALSGYFLVANIYPVLVSVRHPYLFFSDDDLTSLFYVGEPEASTASDCCNSSATRSHCALIQGLIL